MSSGSVKWFDSKKGFGFIHSTGIERDIFVHFSGIVGDGFRKLKYGDEVEFDVAQTDKGPQAHNVIRRENLTRPGDAGGQDPT